MTQKKGILLTLAVLVLFVLMLGELATYVAISISYDNIASSGSAAFSSATLLNFISSGSSSFLAASLNNSLNALTAYESAPSLRTYHFVNNTAYALTSLMTNGTIYGTGMSSYMGGAMLNGYTSALRGAAALQGGVFTVSNLTLTVYQVSSLYLTAKLTGLVVLNASTGTIAYPISATANVSLNGTQSLLGAQNANPYYIEGAQLPQATLIGNTFAIAGSRSPFMFAYGTAIYTTSTTCSGVPTQFQNGNYILVAPTWSDSGICGMGGLVTNSVSTPPLAPYLVFPYNVVSQNVIGAGTSALLDGSGLALLNPSALQASIQNGYYLQSVYAPSYLQASQQQAVGGSGPGSFSFGALNRQTASFSGPASNIITGGSFSGNQLTVTLWVKPSSTSGSASRTLFNSIGTSNVGLGFVTGNTYMTEKLFVGSNTYAFNANQVAMMGNAWNFVALSINNGAASTYTGQSGNSTISVAAGPYSLASLQIGGASGFSGNVSNVQLYSSALSPAQISRIYTNGLGGTPITNSSLMGWYPLNGNANDYSGVGTNGIAANIIYPRLSGYTVDQAFSNLPNAYNTSVVKGALNCANLGQCTNSSLSHLYLGTRPLSVLNGIVLNESETLGIYNGVLPNGVDFLGKGAFIQTANGYTSNAYTVGFWFYAQGPNGARSWMLNSPSGVLKVLATATSMQVVCGSADISGTTSVPYNTWFYATATCNNNGATDYAQGYLNGASVLSGSAAASALPPVNSLIFGNSSNFGGIISDVQLYNSVLTSTQVQSLYVNDTVGGLAPTGYWPLTSSNGGLMNQTPDTAAGNTGSFYNSNGMCTSQSVARNTCGAFVTQP